MKKILIFLMSIILICGISVSAIAANSDCMIKTQVQKQAQDQTRDCTQDQTRDCTQDQTRDCTQYQTRDCTQDQARDCTQYQTRDCTQDQTRDCTQDQTRNRLQDQSCMQTEVTAAEKEQAQLQIRDRLLLQEQAKAQYQERMQLQTETQCSFSDTKQHWASEQISSAYCWGLINGYPNGNFNPDGYISGTEGVLMMSRLMNSLDSEVISAASELTVDFTLVPEWAREQMQEQSALRIAAESQCYGEEKLNRLQFAVMLAKAVGLEAENVSEDTVVFLDQSEIPAEDLAYVEALRVLGIIQGCDGYFYTTKTVTRAEAAAMLTRVMDIVK